MLFNSIEFIYVFLPVTLALFWFLLIKLNKDSYIVILLIIISLLFYSYWSVCFAQLMVVSVTINWAMGEAISKYEIQSIYKKICLVAGISLNLLLLGYFKYASFLVENLNHLGFSLESIADRSLPIGISFYTFTQIGYLVDLYKMNKSKNYSFLKYLLFIIFFPQLIAGPILCHSEFMPQLHREKWRFNSRNLVIGATIFSVGLFKKIIVADTLAQWASPVFESADIGIPISFFIAWQGAIAYTLQLYFDFSAYSDMAVGIGNMFNIKFPINFFSPYKATSIIDFWRRWHITLSKFLRDYLYFPLGGSRVGELRKYVNLLVVMLVGGFWHGASWNFILWGGLHGIYLCLNHGWRKLEGVLTIPTANLFKKLTSWGLTFISIVASWVVFRAETLGGARNILSGMVGMQGFFLPESYKSQLGIVSNLFSHLGVIFDSSEIAKQTTVTLGSRGTLIIFISLLVTLFSPNVYQVMKDEYLALDTYMNLEYYPSPKFQWRPTRLFLVLTSIIFIVSVCALFSANESEFLYFQF